MNEENGIIPYQRNSLIPRVAHTLKLTSQLLVKADKELIPYRKGDRWGFCNKDKTIIIDCKYDKVSRFDNGISRVEFEDKVRYIDNNGIILDHLNKFISEDSYFDTDNECLTANCISIYPYTETGLISEFHEGMSRHIKNGRLGFINNNGDLVIPHTYHGDFHHAQSYFSEGLARVYLHRKWGFIDKMGTVVIPIMYDFVTPFKNGVSLVRQNHKVALIDMNGKNIFPYFDEVLSTFLCNSMISGFSDGLLHVNIDGKCGFINAYGDLIIENIYDDVSSFQNGFAKVKNKKWGAVDQNGNVVIPTIYDKLHDSEYGYRVAIKNGLYGLLSDIGKIQLPFIYERLAIYDSRLLVARYHSKSGIIDFNGGTIIDFIYDDLIYDIDFNAFEAIIDGKKGSFNINSKNYIDLDCDIVGFLSEDILGIAKNRKCGYFDINGNAITKLVYDEIYLFKNGIAKIAKNQQPIGYVDRSGTQYWED